YTNVLNCIDLAGVPVRAADRSPEHPLVVAGGHCAFNPEPLADFVDLFVMGDGEEAVGEITDVVREWKTGGRTPGSRQAVLRALASVPGVYVPSMYDVAYDGPWLASVTPRHPDVPERVEKRTVADLADWPYPKNQLVPLTEVVHDPVNCGQVSRSLPSLRVDAFTVGIATEIQKVRRTGLTFAPEAGTWRMRQVINKLIREEDLYEAVEAAYSQGWRRVKLYFMVGVPTETDADVLG